MRPLSLLAVLCLALAPAVAQSRDADVALERALLDATNAARAQHGLAPLAPDEGLARAARAHAAENARRGVLDHGSPDPARDTPLERVARAGVALLEVGENLARLPVGDPPGRAVEGWLASPPHRRNLLDPSFTHVGFGAADGPGGVYLAQLLAARPLRRLAAEARDVHETLTRWTAVVQGPAGARAMAFLDGEPVAALTLDGGEAELVVELPPGATGELAIGVPTGERAYRRSDGGWLDAARGWRRDPSQPVGTVRVVGARAQPWLRSQVEVVLAYRDASAPLRLFVDGEHLPRAVPVAGRLEVRLPATPRPREITVGLASDDGTARVLERFTLLPGPPPALRPGVPSGTDSEGPWTRPGTD